MGDVLSDVSQILTDDDEVRLGYVAAAVATGDLPLTEDVLTTLYRLEHVTDEKTRRSLIDALMTIIVEGKRERDVLN